jgi:hypothetical protein
MGTWYRGIPPVIAVPEICQELPYVVCGCLGWVFRQPEVLDIPVEVTQVFLIILNGFEAFAFALEIQEEAFNKRP